MLMMLKKSFIKGHRRDECVDDGQRDDGLTPVRECTSELSILCASGMCIFHEDFLFTSNTIALMCLMLSLLHRSTMAFSSFE